MPPVTAASASAWADRVLASSGSFEMKMPAQREFLMLGPLEARLDGEAVPLGGGKRLAVLGMLLVKANEPVSTDSLIDGLWGERPPATARTTVQVYIAQLRRLLEPGRQAGSLGDVIARGPSGYVLQVEQDGLDGARFEALAVDGRQALLSGNWNRAAEILRTALALWRGPALADFAFEPWAQTEAGRLEELRLVCLEERIEADLACGRDAGLVGELEVHVADHPLRERPRGQLMLALYRSGRQAEALRAYQDARHALVEELGVEPSSELRDLEAAILRQEEWLRIEPERTQPRTNLPAAPSPLIGRERELEQTMALLLQPHLRLLTLTGPGGTGKTRLALALAEAMLSQSHADSSDRVRRTRSELRHEFPEGVLWVSLEALRDPELVMPKIAHVLGAKNDLAGHIGDKRLLLLLDNLEQLLEAAPALAQLLAATSNLKLLVTSRERLRISGEHEYPVPPLSAHEAVELFGARARAVIPGFAGDNDVAEICRRLDGLPLALELAAARVKVLTPAQILERLERPLDLLTGGLRDAPERQRTLRSTIAGSYDLLPPGEQQLFAAISVFAGGCTLEAAEAVCGADLDMLQMLADKSLLRYSERRYWMLETIREFAIELLREHGDATGLQRGHALCYLALSERAEPELRGADQQPWLERLELDHDNLRAALAWAMDGGDPELGLRIAAALWRFWRIHGHVTEGRRLLEALLPLAQDAPAWLQARALLGVSRLSMDEGDVAGSLTHAKGAFAAARRSRSDVEIAATTENLGLMTSFTDAKSRALALLEDGVARFRKLGDPISTADALNNLAGVLLEVGDADRAAVVGEEALALQRGAQNARGVEFTLHSLGYIALRQGDLERAYARLEESLIFSQELGDLAGIGWALEGLAQVAVGRRDDRAAVVLWAAGESVRSETGVYMQPSESAIHDDALAAVRARLGEPAFAEAWAEGAPLTPGDAVAYALSSGRGAGEMSGR